MYVCICHGVTEKDIKKAVKQGADSIEALRELTGATSGCGSCVDVALDVMSEQTAKPLPEFLNVIPATPQAIPA